MTPQPTWWQRLFDWLRADRMTARYTYTFSRALSPEEQAVMHGHIDEAFAKAGEAFDAMNRAFEAMDRARTN